MQDCSGLDDNLDDTFNDPDYNDEEENQVESEDDSDVASELGMQNNGKSPEKEAHGRKKISHQYNSPRPKSPEKEAHGRKKVSHLDNSPRPKNDSEDESENDEDTHVRGKEDIWNNQNAPQKQQNRNLECRSSIRRDWDRDLFAESEDEGTQKQGQISDSTLDVSSKKLFHRELDNLEAADDGEISDERDKDNIMNEEWKSDSEEEGEKSDSDEEDEKSDSDEDEEKSDSDEDEEKTVEREMMEAIREDEDELASKLPANYLKLVEGFANKTKERFQKFAKCSKEKLIKAQALKRKRGNC